MSMSQGKEVEERVDERSVDDLLSFINGKGTFCVFISLQYAMFLFCFELLNSIVDMAPHIISFIEPTLMLTLQYAIFLGLLIDHFPC